MTAQSLIAVGDMLLARDLHYPYLQAGIDGIVAPEIRKMFEVADGVVGNVEAVITPHDIPMSKGEHKPYYFRLTDGLATLLSDLRFSVVTTANNHTLDYGIRGLGDHRSWLTTNRVLAPGSGNNLDEALAPAYFNCGKTVVAIISVCCVKPRLPCASAETPGVARTDTSAEIPEFVAATMNEAKRNAHIVLLSPHWIENWVVEPPKHVRDAARQLIDMGFDGILGHSSHLMHGVEIYQGKPIIYDMGTFLSDRVSGHRLMPRSAIFKLTIDEHYITSVDITPVTLAPCRVDLADSETVSHVRQVLERDLREEATLEETDDGFTILTNGRRQEQERARVHEVDMNSQYQWASQIRDEPSGNVSDPLPKADADWGCSFENGIMLSSVSSAEAVGHRSGFRLDVELTNTRPMDGNWVVEVLLRSRQGTLECRERHPFAQGTALPCQWEEKGATREICVVRPPRRMVPGCYDLFWGLYDSETSYHLKTIQGLDHFYVGPLYVFDGEIPATCAGVDWSGRLPHSVKNRMLHDCLYKTEERVLLNLREQLQGFAVSWGQLLSAFRAKYEIIPEQDLVFIGVYDQVGAMLRWGSSRRSLNAVFRRNVEALRSNSGLADFDLDSPQTGMFIEVVKRGETLPAVVIGEHELKMSGLSFDVNGKTLRLSPSTAQENQAASVADKVSFICEANRLDTNYVLERIERRTIAARLLHSTIVIHRNDNVTQLVDTPFCQKALLSH
ncbi:MAG: CapA family protein [Planctomycetes bacterium]|nr:CapA family protein [Planctomycetota bacterium]